MSVTNIEYPSRIPGQGPSTLDYMRHNAMRMDILRMPNVSFLCQSANIPSISLGTATQPTPFIDIPHPGDKLKFEPLSIKFVVQEDMENYKEIYRWMVGLGFPNTRQEYKKLIDSESYRFPATNYTSSEGVYSDIVLFLLNSDNNPTIRVNFIDAFPLMLSGLDVDVSSGTGQYVYASATFAFRFFDIENITPVNTPVEDTEGT